MIEWEANENTSITTGIRSWVRYRVVSLVQSIPCGSRHKGWLGRGDGNNMYLIMLQYLRLPNRTVGPARPMAMCSCRVTSLDTKRKESHRDRPEATTLMFSKVFEIDLRIMQWFNMNELLNTFKKEKIYVYIFSLKMHKYLLDERKVFSE